MFGKCSKTCFWIPLYSENILIRLNVGKAGTKTVWTSVLVISFPKVSTCKIRSLNNCAGEFWVLFVWEYECAAYKILEDRKTGIWDKMNWEKLKNVSSAKEEIWGRARFLNARTEELGCFIPSFRSDTIWPLDESISFSLLHLTFF